MSNIKVTKNIYGNFRGFETGVESVCLGCNEFDAKYWLLNKFCATPNTEILPTSYYTEVDVLEFENFLKD